MNISAVSLMEIVGEPDIISADEAGLNIYKIGSFLIYLNTCDENMQEVLLLVFEKLLLKT